MIRVIGIGEAFNNCVDMDHLTGVRGMHTFGNAIVISCIGKHELRARKKMASAG